MAHKVQAQAGGSLSDIYDVKGGQAPIDRLITGEVQLVHEMGATIQSERFSSTIRRRSAGALGQNVNWDDEISDLPAGVSRILGITVLTNAARISVATVSLRDPGSGRERVLFAFQTGVGTSAIIGVRIQENNAAVANTSMLVPGYPPELSMLIGADQPQQVPDIAFRGTTTGFGAGTVTPILLIHLAFAAIGGISSRGLSIPSW